MLLNEKNLLEIVNQNKQNVNPILTSVALIYNSSAVAEH